MTCSAKDYLDSARANYDESGGEPAARTAVSRAYYGAYHAAKSYHLALPSPGSVRNEAGSHKQLISQLRYPTVGGREKARSLAIGNLLMGAFALRVNADYDLDHSIGWFDAKTAISKAEQIFEAMPASQAASTQAQ